MRRVFAVLLAVCCFTACSDIKTEKVKTWSVGRSEADLDTCLGIPDHKVQEADKSVIAEWAYKDSLGSFNVPLTAVAMLPLTLPIAMAGSSMSIAGSGDCNVIVTLVNGKEVRMVYSGESGGITGRNAVCVGIIRGCLNLWSKTEVHAK